MTHTEQILMSATAIETMLWHIQREIMIRWGVDAGHREIAPLARYINTGRASVDFLRRLYTAKPFMVARKIHQGGSNDEIIKRVQHYIGYAPNY